MDKFKRVTENGAELISLMAGWITLIFAVVTLLSSLLRYVFSYSIRGFFDFGEVLLVVIVALPWGYTLLSRGHPTMDIVVTRLRGKPKAILFAIGEILSAAFCVILAWAIIYRFLLELKTGTFLLELKDVPRYPFWLAVVIGALVFLVISLVQTAGSLRRISTKSTKEELPKSDNHITAG